MSYVEICNESLNEVTFYVDNWNTYLNINIDNLMMI